MIRDGCNDGAGAVAPAPFCVQPWRVVFDTNVLLSLWVFVDSRFAPLRQEVESRRWQALTRDDCLAEFGRVLGYPQFALAPERQTEVLAAWSACAQNFSGPGDNSVTLPRCHDKDDQKFLELARDAAAEWLVTADKALLRMARRGKLRGLFHILTPDAALEHLLARTAANLYPTAAPGLPSSPPTHSIQENPCSPASSAP